MRCQHVRLFRIIRTRVVSRTLQWNYCWRDDGAGEVREYQVNAQMHSGEPLPTVTVPASSFNSMRWVPDAFGARARIKVGMTNQQHTAAAIQNLSRPVQRRIYTHTGWRQINGRWHFLHGAGAIAASGYVSGIEVDLGQGLINYHYLTREATTLVKRYGRP